ncbi:MAG TPA: polysaccharide biosynthesis/export family protein [Pyrinomonadaceae bacterium]|jgi:protein involved in polysaccharide export with SLBB domain
MKKVLALLVLALVLAAPSALASAQTKEGSGDEAQKAVASDHAGAATKEQPAANPASSSAKPEKKAAEQTRKDEGKASNLSSSTASVTRAGVAATGNAATTDAPAKTSPAVASAPPAKDMASNAGSAARTNAESAQPLTDVYRVGIGDVLDIRLANASNRDSTLYTILEGGLLEYPLAGEPVRVSGMTVDEIDARLTSLIKVFDKPELVITVRDYASHTVIVTGLVSSPGARVLRREAVPLYVVLAEALPRPEAARATILRPGTTQSLSVDLSDATATSVLVIAGDVIKVSAAPAPGPQYYFIGGQIVSPGQKDFHAGLTLTQAVLASGGIARFASSKIRVSRQGADGRLVATEYNLKEIEAGKVPDPALQAGDRIEVGRGHW